MVLWGKGIRKGVRIPYAEHIDIVPTLCSVAQVAAPQTSQGQVIAGALEGVPGAETTRRVTVKDLNEQLGAYNKLIIAVGYAIDQLPQTRQGWYYSRFDAVKQDFYDIGRFTEWPRFKNLDELYGNNRNALNNLQTLKANLDKISK
jgi:arylsulfatase A-like enzyme